MSLLLMQPHSGLIIYRQQVLQSCITMYTLRLQQNYDGVCAEIIKLMSAMVACRFHDMSEVVYQCVWDELYQTGIHISMGCDHVIDQKLKVIWFILNDSG